MTKMQKCDISTNNYQFGLIISQILPMHFLEPHTPTNGYHISSHMTIVSDLRNVPQNIFLLSTIPIRTSSLATENHTYCCIPYRTKFWRTKFSAPSRNFGSFARRNFFIGFLFPHTIHKKICFNMRFLLILHVLDFSGQNISADKTFGGQNFRQQVRFSAVLSAEILSDKVFDVRNMLNNKT